MSDRSSVEITLYSVDGKEQQLIAIFGDWRGWHDGDVANPAHYVEGCEVTDDEMTLGTLHEVGPELEALGVSYYGEQSAKYEYAAEVRMFTPELGVFASNSNGEGCVLVDATAIDQAVAEWDETGDDYRSLIAKLEAITGTAHRSRFAELRKAAEAV